MSHSPDRQWWWDGEKWVPAISEDRAWWFDGHQWVPNARTDARRQPTAWTRPLQAAVIALQLAGPVAGALVLASIWPAMRDSVLSQMEIPAGQDTAQFRSSLDATIAVGFGVAAVLAAAIIAVIVIGTLLRWTWLYWFLMIAYAISILGIPSTLAQLLGGGLPIGAGGQAIHYPVAAAATQLSLQLANLGLLVWMVQAYRRYGPWAEQRVAVQAP